MEIRGNVATRMRKVAEQGEMDATVLALAGLTRLKFKLKASGAITGQDVSDGLLASVLNLDTMLPCVGQGAIGIEIRQGDARMTKICARLNHVATFHAVTAERAFLRAMGGGCQSPVGSVCENFRRTGFAQGNFFPRRHGQKCEGQGTGGWSGPAGRTDCGEVEVIHR